MAEKSLQQIASAYIQHKQTKDSKHNWVLDEIPQLMENATKAWNFIKEVINNIPEDDQLLGEIGKELLTYGLLFRINHHQYPQADLKIIDADVDHHIKTNLKFRKALRYGGSWYSYSRTSKILWDHIAAITPTNPQVAEALINEIVTDYITHEIASAHKQRNPLYVWAWEEMDELARSSPAIFWNLICRVTDQIEDDDAALGLIGAGALEDFIGKYGPEYIERIETRIRQHPKFRRAVADVWKTQNMDDKVWDRLYRLYESMMPKKKP